MPAMAEDTTQVPNRLSGRMVNSSLYGGGAALVVLAVGVTVSVGDVLNMVIDVTGLFWLLVVVFLIFITSMLRWSVEHFARRSGARLVEISSVTTVRILFMLAAVIAVSTLAVLWLLAWAVGLGFQHFLFEAFVLVLVGCPFYVAIPLKLLDDCVLLARNAVRTDTAR